jgi:hypothetical protein
MNDFLSKINGQEGFYFGHITSESDLEELRLIVKTHFLRSIKADFPSLLERFEDNPLSNYHENCSTIPHGKYWSKDRRILPKDLLSRFKNTELYYWLARNFNVISITGEEGHLDEEVYWRLVRPQEANDVGPLHADAWFWDVGSQKIPKGKERIKVWIPLCSEPGVNGFLYIPGSHKRNITFQRELKHGKWKPVIDQDISNEAIVYQGVPGQPIVFHDKLIHGGSCAGTSTRISLEFTILIQRSDNEL